MAFFDNFNNPLYAPIEKGIGGLSNLTEGMNIFAAKPSEALTGILTTDQQEKLKNQALFQGLLGAGMTYLAQPKNQGYGSALPYLGKAYLGGMQASQGAYNTAMENELTKMKIAKEQRDALLDYQKAIPTDVREYEYAVKQGYKGTFNQYAREMANLKAPKTILQMPSEKAILETDKDTLTGLTSSANSARSIANYTRNINALIGDQQGSGVIKLGADVQNYLGIPSKEANVNQVVQAIATKGATEIRTPGSGSTSDIEFNAYRSAFPTLATSKEGRQLMVQIAEANAIRQSKLSDWARKNIQAGTFSYEGLAAYDNSLGLAVSESIKKKVDELVAKPTSNQPPGLSEQGKKAYDFYINQNRPSF